MNSKNYVNKTVSIENSNRAKKLGLSFNEYVNYLIGLAEQEKTTAESQRIKRLESLEGTVASMAEALKHQRYLTDGQSLKIDKQNELIGKLINAFSADIEFIQALKKEIVK